MDEDLLLKFLTRTADERELEEIGRWIRSDKKRADELFEMERLWSLRDELRYSDEKRLDEAYKELLGRLERRGVGVRKERRRSRLRSILAACLRYAAIVVLVSVVSIEAYKYATAKAEPAPVENHIQVPGGQRVLLTLSDGTRVWLNARSEFSYPSRFSKDARNVRLEGEGFFEVAHDADRPFVVKGGLLDIKVLGTKFNMRNYEDEASSVTLVEGKVEVATADEGERLTLRPREQVVYSPETGITLNRDVDTDVWRAWTKGELIFRDQPLRAICRELERKFNVRIDIRDPRLAEELFTCHFDETVGIQDVMSLLGETRKLTYSFEKNNIIIRSLKK